MEAILFEKPLLIGVLGAISAVVLGFIWLQSARRQVLYALITVLILTLLGILMARFVVTDREAVDALLHEAARAVERNDLAGLLKLIHPQAQTIRDRAQAEFPNYEFHEVKIKSNLEITFDKPDHPTEAVAKFNVVVVGSQRQGLIQNRRVPRYCSVTFRKDGSEWRVIEYEHADAREGLLQR